MKIQVRQSCYETNSSSQHSLVVTKDSRHYSRKEIDEELDFLKWTDGVWDIYEFDMNFGRTPFRIISSFKDKWLYMCAALVHEYKDDIYNELERLAFKYINQLEKISLPKVQCSFANKDSDKFEKEDLEYLLKHGKTEEELKTCLQELETKWNLPKIKYWESNGYFEFELPYIGYCEDYGELSKFLKEKDLSLEEFLTNKKYIIIQDGDEYCYWDDAKDSGLINKDIIDYEYEF